MVLTGNKRRRSCRNKESPSKKKKEVDFGSWKDEDDLLIFTHNQPSDSEKLATFDFDGTLVKPKSGRAFALNPDDWLVWDEVNVKKKLQQLEKDGYAIYVFSNQMGISKGKLTADDVRIRMNGLMKALLPIKISLILCAKFNDEYRKPGIGMWEKAKQYVKGNNPDKSRSFYVGDAAGRKGFKSKAIGKKRNDHSCGDRKFAMNVGIKFYTPDEYFLGEKPVSYDLKGIDIKKLKPKFEKMQKIDPKTYIKKAPEMVLMVGFPGSGKSHFTNTVFVPNKYVRINLDTLKNHTKGIKLTKQAFDEGKSVVIDNTNPDIKSRDRYIKIAKQKKIPYRCFHFTTNIDMAFHLNNFRSKKTGQKPVPKVVFYTFRKKFVDPSTTNEGFSEVVKIDFNPQFKNKETEELFYQYT